MLRKLISYLLILILLSSCSFTTRTNKQYFGQECVEGFLRTTCFSYVKNAKAEIVSSELKLCTGYGTALIQGIEAIGMPIATVWGASLLANGIAASGDRVNNNNNLNNEQSQWQSQSQSQNQQQTSSANASLSNIGQANSYKPALTSIKPINNHHFKPYKPIYNKRSYK